MLCAMRTPESVVAIGQGTDGARRQSPNRRERWTLSRGSAHDSSFRIAHVERRSIVLSSEEPTNQGVVGSNPAGRANFQRLGTQNQVLLVAVGPLWDLLSTGSCYLDGIEGLGVQNQVLLPLLWNSVGVLIHTRALVLCDS